MTDEPDNATDFSLDETPTHGKLPAHHTGDESLMGIPLYIGKYHVRRLIGHGGMGAVYEAMQDQPRRVVALKVMRTGAASRSALRRFMYESQLLARLRHPGIAQVFDAGTHTENGVRVPYFAMEYIAGARSLTEHAEERDLSTADRIVLFIKICDAVHHGHQRGIVHRDLKPQNILVDSESRPKIIDFGVARATDSDMAVTTQQTDVGALVGTLQYMSPEQIAADPHDIDTRSDVYSLGVILYQLVCRTLPYDVGKVSMPEAMRIVRESNPARPSAVSAFVKRDLEVILLKALEKDRDRRYRSAADLADDLRRYLKSEPVTARPASLAYQLKLFTKRNKPFVVAASTVFIALLGATIISSSMAVRARRDNAQLKKFTQYTRVALGADNPAQAQGSLSLEQAAELAGTTFADAPLAEARVRLILARGYQDKNQPTQAHEQAKIAKERATQDVTHSGIESQVLRLQAADISARALLTSGDITASSSVIEESLKGWERADPALDEHITRLLDLAILIPAANNDWNAARTMAQRRLQAAQRGGNAPASQLVRPLHNLSLIESRAGRPADAKRNFEAAIALATLEPRTPRDPATDFLWPGPTPIGDASPHLLASVGLVTSTLRTHSIPAYQIELCAAAFNEFRSGDDTKYSLATDLSSAWISYVAQASGRTQSPSAAGFREFVGTNTVTGQLSQRIARFAGALDLIENLPLRRFSRWQILQHYLTKVSPVLHDQPILSNDQLDELIRGAVSPGVSFRTAWKLVAPSEEMPLGAAIRARETALIASQRRPDRADYVALTGIAQYRLALAQREQQMIDVANTTLLAAIRSLEDSITLARSTEQAYQGDELSLIFLAAANLAHPARREQGITSLGQAKLRLGLRDDEEPAPALSAMLTELCESPADIDTFALDLSSLLHYLREPMARAKTRTRN